MHISDANVAAAVQAEQHACEHAIIRQAEKHRLRVHRQAEKHRRWTELMHPSRLLPALLGFSASGVTVLAVISYIFSGRTLGILKRFIGPPTRFITGLALETASPEHQVVDGHQELLLLHLPVHPLHLHPLHLHQGSSEEALRRL